MTAVRRILVVGPSWVGDMVMAQSLFMTLQAEHPGVQIDVLAPQWSLPILQRMPQVHQGIAMPLGHGQLDLRTRWRLGRQLAAHGYDQAIVLPGSLKSALVPWFAGIPVRTGFTGEMRYGLLNDRRPLDKQALPMTVQRFVALGLSPHPVQAPDIAPPQLVADAENATRQLTRLGLNTERPAVAFMPCAEYGPAKQWPAAHFAQLAKDLIARGQQVWILGSAKDRAVGDVIAQAADDPHVHNLCGQTELADVVDLLSLCTAAVSNDSGLMHVAAALGKPMAAIYGSSDPKHTPPLSPQAHVIYLRLDCSPCFERQCPLGHTRCLNDIQPGQVLEVLP
jgi:heptosyltransferase II